MPRHSKRTSKNTAPRATHLSRTTRRRNLSCPSAPPGGPPRHATHTCTHLGNSNEPLGPSRPDVKTAPSTQSCFVAKQTLTCLEIIHARYARRRGAGPRVYRATKQTDPHGHAHTQSGSNGVVAPRVQKGEPSRNPSASSTMKRACASFQDPTFILVVCLFGSGPRRSPADRLGFSRGLGAHAPEPCPQSPSQTRERHAAVQEAP